MGRFYSAAEYDIQPMVDYPGEVLELGRSCIAKDARNTATMQMLWRGIALYVYHYNIQVMFGCASMPGHRSERSMRRRCPTSTTIISRRRRSACARCPSRYVKMDMLEPGSYDPRKAMARVPPLIKGYLRLGGFVGDGAVIDPEFSTTDVCIIVKTELVTEKYIRHYERGDARAGRLRRLRRSMWIGSPLRGAFRLLSYLAADARPAAVLSAGAWRCASGRSCAGCRSIYHRIVCFILGIKVQRARHSART